jgi:hypothetical protein
MVLLFPSLALGETMDDLVKRDGIYYKKFNPVKRSILLLIRKPGHQAVPFTGTVTGMTEGAFSNGKKDGPWVYNQKNKNRIFVLKKGTYKDGKKEGPWREYYENSRGFDLSWITQTSKSYLRKKMTYKDGKLDGPLFEYDLGDRTSAPVKLRRTIYYSNGARVESE